MLTIIRIKNLAKAICELEENEEIDKDKQLKYFHKIIQLCRDIIKNINTEPTIWEKELIGQLKLEEI